MVIFLINATLDQAASVPARNQIAKPILVFPKAGAEYPCKEQETKATKVTN